MPCFSLTACGEAGFQLPFVWEAFKVQELPVADEGWGGWLGLMLFQTSGRNVLSFLSVYSPGNWPGNGEGNLFLCLKSAKDSSAFDQALSGNPQEHCVLD